MRSSTGFMIRGFRAAQGLTIEDLAEKCGLSVRQLGDIERGAHTNTRTLEKIAEQLGVRSDDLAFDGDYPEEHLELHAQLEAFLSRGGGAKEAAKSLMKTLLRTGGS